MTVRETEEAQTLSEAAPQEQMNQQVRPQAYRQNPKRSRAYDSAELLLEQDSQTILDVISRTPRLHINTLLLTVLMSILIGLQSFLAVDLPSATEGFIGKHAVQYSFLLPVSLFAGAFLGPWLGGIAYAVFLVAGLFVWPLFSGGGGIDYWMQPGGCYIFAIFIGTIISGRLTRMGFKDPNPGVRSLLVYSGGAMSVVATHLIAIVLMLVVNGILMPGIFSSGSYDMGTWITNLTLEPILFDILATTICVWFVRSIRLCLLPALY